MFKKEFTPSAKSKLKSSVQRNIRAKILTTYPLLEPHIETILPKKSQLDLVKVPDRITIYSLDGKPLFWQHMDDAIMPSLRVVHAYPWAFRRVRIDRGGVRFVLSGATLMVPGLTSEGGRLPKDGKGADVEKGGVYGNAGEELVEGDVVVVDAEGKEEACMVGVLKMGSAEMREKRKGVAVENGHFLGDGLWRMDLS